MNFFKANDKCAAVINADNIAWCSRSEYEKTIWVYMIGGLKSADGFVLNYETTEQRDADYERLRTALGWGKKFGLPVNHGSYIGQTLHLCKECHESNKAIFENPKR